MFTCKLLVADTKPNYVIHSRRTECASTVRSVSSLTVYTNCGTWPGIRSTRPSCAELFTRKDIALTEHAATSSTRNVTCPNRNRLPCACYPTLCPLLRWRICPCRRTAYAVCRQPPVRTRSRSPRRLCVLHHLHPLKLDCPFSTRSAHPHCYRFTDNLAVWLPRGTRFSFFFLTAKTHLKPAIIDIVSAFLKNFLFGLFTSIVFLSLPFSFSLFSFLHLSYILNKVTDNESECFLCFKQVSKKKWNFVDVCVERKIVKN